MSSESEMFLIRVPASTANLGPGFDSMGMALSLYLEIYGSPSDRWEVVPLTEEMTAFPTDDSNFIVQIAKKTAACYGKELAPYQIQVSSNIPLARGLGSSASAIVAGIELANYIADLNLSKEQKNRHASLYEGHPDNVGASIFGGLVVGWHTNEQTNLTPFPVNGIKVIVVIPNFELLTEDSRNVLPSMLSYKEAIDGSAAANMLLAGFVTENWELVGKMMRSDRFHEPYRAKLVPHLAQVAEIATRYGAYGTALSGAGPTILCLVPEDVASLVEESLASALPECTVKELMVDNEGSKLVILTEEDVKDLPLAQLK